MVETLINIMCDEIVKTSSVRNLVSSVSKSGFQSSVAKPKTKVMTLANHKGHR